MLIMTSFLESLPDKLSAMLHMGLEVQDSTRCKSWISERRDITHRRQSLMEQELRLQNIKTRLHIFERRFLL